MAHKNLVRTLGPTVWLILAAMVAAGSMMGPSHFASPITPALTHMLSDGGGPTFPCGGCH